MGAAMCRDHHRECQSSDGSSLHPRRDSTLSMELGYASRARHLFFGGCMAMQKNKVVDNDGATEV